jgi:hypothetical protein
VIRADVAGRSIGRISYGSTSVTAPDGTFLDSAPPMAEALIIVDLDVGRENKVGPGSGGGSAP